MTLALDSMGSENMAVDVVVRNMSEAAAVQDESLAALADATYTRIAKFFAEVMDDADFCGIAVDQKVTDDGRIASLTLIPVDDVGGTPTRRVAR